MVEAFHYHISFLYNVFLYNLYAFGMKSSDILNTLSLIFLKRQFPQVMLGNWSAFGVLTNKWNKPGIDEISAEEFNQLFASFVHVSSGDPCFTLPPQFMELPNASLQLSCVEVENYLKTLKKNF